MIFMVYFITKSFGSVIFFFWIWKAYLSILGGFLYLSSPMSPFYFMVLIVKNLFNGSLICSVIERKIPNWDVTFIAGKIRLIGVMIFMTQAPKSPFVFAFNRVSRHLSPFVVWRPEKGMKSGVFPKMQTLLFFFVKPPRDWF